jgi:16S rRNA processing protein RimM
LSTEFYLVGRVRRAHGIKGELVVESLTDAPDATFAPGRRVFVGTREGDLAKGNPELRILRSSPFKGGWIIAFEGIDDRSTAETWRDRTFLLPEDEVEPPSEDQLFIHDLVGMRVLRETGDEIGEVSEVFEFPQGLVIEVKRPEGKPVMLPFDDHTVTNVDAELRTIRVDPVDGLID